MTGKRGRKPGQKARVTPQTAKVRSLVLDLRRKGCSIPEIVRRMASAGYKVGQSTVGDWVKAAQDAGELEKKRAPRAIAVEAEELAAAPSETINPDRLTLEQIDAELVDVSKWMAKKRADDDELGYQRLLNIRGALMDARRRAEPPAPPDPHADPANVEAAEILRGRLLREIEEVEARERGRP